MDSDETADEATDAPNHHGPDPTAATQALPVPQVPVPAPPSQPVRAIITVHFIRHHQGVVLAQLFPIEAGTAVTIRRLWNMVQLFRFRPEDPATAFLRRKPTTSQFSIDAATNTGTEEGFDARCLQDADPDRVYAVFWDTLDKIMDVAKVFHDMMARSGTPLPDEVVNGEVYLIYT